MSTMATLYPLLKEMGLDDGKSQQFIETLADGLAENLATQVDIANLRGELKEDITNLRTELKEDIASLRAELKEDIASLRAEILKWMFGVWVTLFLAIIALFLKL